MSYSSRFDNMLKQGEVMTNLDNEQILKQAFYLIENHSTIRATAKIFNIPKSTLHHNLSTKLKYINLSLYREVKKQLNENFKIKHIHGGESTKLKYEKLKKNINLNDIFENII